ncbi:alcohol dehydrogenase [Mycolicibacterium moriokaense]|uniref:Zinc-binding alcohol dehydrogenase n=1 Tax=Mycolicibacterium moriokaense TaxID=39691 RepID=A0AAD1M7J6_9MYCO|nr:NADP-dependent oxidoreductase [Mycolicibacterium moriokaense]MCV7038343.1 NADP-dependent oxidoreductase [Mycolicibacterium moriokaense]ORB24314.1 alcohol dehydrogenase [Mycolicibacterium moriokaense]BBX02536.1 zinc-binding alcohol dehydrogenase [Mycolicibacterium moriokaense]
MKAVGFHRFGGPEVLEVLDLPEPHAGRGEVRIKVTAAGVNPSDTVSRSGQAKALMQKADPNLQYPPGPYVVGWDAAGVIDEIGEDTPDDLAIGDHVMAVTLPVGTGGAYVEYLVVSANSVVHTPAGWDDVAASTLPLNGLTARRALDLMALPPGSTVAITGAAGAFGGYAIELAKADGLRVIADASEADSVLVTKLGADVVVPRGDDVARSIREAVPDGVHGLADGALLDDKVTAAVRDGGRIATLRSFTGGHQREITWHPVHVMDYLRARTELDRLRQQAEDGLLTARIADVLPIENASEAHRRLEAGGVRGRLVLAL